MSTYPSLPGFAPTQDIESNHYRRVSHTKLKEKRNSKEQKYIKYPLPREERTTTPCQKSTQDAMYLTTNQETYKTFLEKEENELFQPAFVKMDRHVLRFYGYFKESVVESRLEQARLRKLVIFYYLEDNSLSMLEPKQSNSGIPQGEILKRRKVQKADGSGKNVGIEDFIIGQDVAIYGKHIRLYDCDQYTREFYKNLGLDQLGAQSEPLDNFETKLANIFYNPLRQGLVGSDPRVPSQKQFLENDRRVLRFYCFSEQQYILHYYLADDTIDIAEVHYPNDGTEHIFTMYLNRAKLPRKFALNQPGQTYAEDFVKAEDFIYGGKLTIYGRAFHINGCDKFTQAYYKKTYNRDFPLASVEHPKAKEYKEKVIPPHNGFGSEEDSIQNVYRLDPKRPKKDFFKWMDNQTFLRFAAKLNTNIKEDIDRRFIITYLLHDDTILVYEPEVRNSGIKGGKFLEKCRYKNVEKNNAYFNPADLIVGEDVTINGFSFKVLEADARTKIWYDQNFKLGQKSGGAQSGSIGTKGQQAVWKKDTAWWEGLKPNELAAMVKCFKGWSMDEMATWTTQKFNEADVNFDKLLDQDEFKVFALSLQPELARRAGMTLTWIPDTDAGYLDELFAAVDADNDGFVTLEEWFEYQALRN